MLRLGSYFGDFTIQAECLACWHMARIDPRSLYSRFGKEAPVYQAIRHFRCSKCGSRKIRNRVRLNGRQGAGSARPAIRLGR